MWWMAPPTASSSAVQPRVKYSFFRHGRHLGKGQTVVDDHALIVKQHGGDQGLARLLLLPRDHGVEAADGVRLQPRHGAAAVQDENQFCHNENPPSFDCALIVAQPKEGLVACGATFMTIA